MTMSTFQTSKQGIEDSGGAPRLKTPYKGPARLINVENRTIDPQNKEETYENILAFTFELGGQNIKGEDVKGKQVEKLEWPPRDDDDAKKTQNKVDRIGYIAKYWVGDEKAASLSGNTWEEYVNNVVAAFEALDDYTQKVVQLKVTGQVYSGEPKLGIPNYKGFISDEQSKSQVDFSQKEDRENLQYMQAKNATPTDNDLVEDADEGANPFDDQPDF